MRKFWNIYKSKNNARTLSDIFNSILSFENDEEYYKFSADVLQLNLMDHVNNMIISCGIGRAMFAEKLKITPEYLTNLFTCDERLTLEMIAKMILVFKEFN